MNGYNIKCIELFLNLTLILFIIENKYGYRKQGNLRLPHFSKSYIVNKITRLTRVSSLLPYTNKQ